MIDHAWFFTTNLSIVSTFPLAITRFLFLYYQNFYTKRFNNYKIALWLVFYDILMCLLHYFLIVLRPSSPYPNLVTVIFFVVTTTFFSSLVVRKIRRMMSLVENSLNKTTLSNLRRAAFVCMFQMLLLSFHLAAFLFTQIFDIVLKFDKNAYNKLVFVYMFIINSYTFVYTLILIVDNLVVLALLKSYRTTAVEVFKVAYRYGIVRLFGRSPGARIHYAIE